MVVITGRDTVIHAFSALTKAAWSAWMPTDRVRGLKAHGSSPAMTALGWVRICNRSAQISSKSQPDSGGSGPVTTVLSRLDARAIRKYTSALS